MDTALRLQPSQISEKSTKESSKKESSKKNLRTNDIADEKAGKSTASPLKEKEETGKRSPIRDDHDQTTTFNNARKLYQRYTYKKHQQKLEQLDSQQLQNLHDFFAENFVKENNRHLILENNTSVNPADGQGKSITLARDNAKPVGICSIRPFSMLDKILSTKSYLIKDFYANEDYNYEQRIKTYRRLFNLLEKDLPEKNFISARIASEDTAAVEALQEEGFRFITAETLFFKKLPAGEPLGNAKDEESATDHSHIKVRPFRDKDLKEVKAIAAENHDISKFHCDLRFDKKQTEQIYLSTLDQTLKSPRHHVFVSEVDGEVAGFVTVIENKVLSKKLGRGYGSLDYICVSRSKRKKGVGLALNTAGINFLHERGLDTLYVKTLAHNYSAIGLLNRGGFCVASQNLILHRLRS